VDLWWEIINLFGFLEPEGGNPNPPEEVVFVQPASTFSANRIVFDESADDSQYPRLTIAIPYSETSHSRPVTRFASQQKVVYRDLTARFGEQPVYRIEQCGVERMPR